MATVYNRGSKHRPRWWCGYKDAGGEWTYCATQQPTKELATRFVQRIEANIAAGRVGIERTGDLPKCRELFDAWSKALTNRNAKDDRYRLANHLRPQFDAMLVRDVTLGVVMSWIDAQRQGTAPRREKPMATTAETTVERTRSKPGPKPKPRAPKPPKPATPPKLSDASIRHNLNLLSRFLGWCVERGTITHNVVRDIPNGRRPTQTAKHNVPWLDDDAMVRKLVRALPDPIGVMFYLANRSGLRTGEVAGLRLSDVGFLAEGTLRVRYSYDGPLKEAKRSDKTKFVPAPDDAETMLGALIARRRDDGAGPEEFLFACPGRKGSFYRKEFVESRWELAAKACGVSLTWYQATRHSFVSRNLASGSSLDEVSAAVGHSSPVVTRRYYDHFVRRTFSSGLRAGLGMGAEQGGQVVSLDQQRARKGAIAAVG